MQLTGIIIVMRTILGGMWIKEDEFINTKKIKILVIVFLNFKEIEIIIGRNICDAFKFEKFPKNVRIYDRGKDMGLIYLIKEGRTVNNKTLINILFNIKEIWRSRYKQSFHI
jgi:hypothetical protein